MYLNPRVTHPSSRLHSSSFAWSNLGHSTLFMFTAHAAHWSKSVGHHLLRTGLWGVGEHGPKNPKNPEKERFQKKQQRSRHLNVRWVGYQSLLRNFQKDLAKRPKVCRRSSRTMGSKRMVPGPADCGSEMKVDKRRHVDISNTLQKLFKHHKRPRATWNNSNESHSDPVIAFDLDDRFWSSPCRVSSAKDAGGLMTCSRSLWRTELGLIVVQSGTSCDAEDW